MKYIIDTDVLKNIDLSLAERNNKEDFIKIMNKLGYKVNWTDTRKYITYTTPEGYKCRDNKFSCFNGIYRFT